MALSRDQIEFCHELISRYSKEVDRRYSHGVQGQMVRPTAFDELLSGIGAELHRLKHGPFTLAEAVTSGRLFAEIDAPEPTPWIVREGVSLFIAKPNGEPSGSSYWPLVPAMCEPAFKLMPEDEP